jgi:hypothetical protein
VSEDSVDYGAPSEAEVDHYRTRLRQLRVWLRNLAREGDPFPSMESRLAPLLALVDELLARPRSNGQIIDGLERELSHMRGRLVDADVAHIELREAQRACRDLGDQVELLREQLRQLTKEMGPVEWFVYRTVQSAAARADELLQKARERWR